MAAGQRYPTIHCGQTARRHTVLRMDRTGRSGTFRQNRTQRHRVWRHAAYLGSLFIAQTAGKAQQRGHTPDVQRLEPWRTEQFPDRNYGPDRQFQGERRRLPARPHPRRSRAERNRKMERHRRNGRKRPADADYRSRLRPDALGAQITARTGFIPVSAVSRRYPQNGQRSDSRRTLCSQAGFVRTGVFAAAPSIAAIRLATRLRHYRPNLAGRMHHPLGIPQ